MAGEDVETEDSLCGLADGEEEESDRKDVVKEHLVELST